MAKRLFGSTGIRGTVFGQIVAASDVEFIPENLVRIGTIWAAFNESPKTILLGRDPRISSEMIQSAVAAGLMAAGCNVTYGGIIPTPVLNLACKQRNCPGIMVTGSHIEKEMNALKFILPDGAEVDWESGEKKVEESFFNPMLRNYTSPLECGNSSNYDFTSAYFDYLSKHIDVDLKGLKVSLDPGNGCMAGGFFSNFLAAKGVNPAMINDRRDGRFPGRGAEPLLQEVLVPLSELVVNTKSNIGIAFDGDGDRAIFVDEKGRIIWGDESLAVLAKYRLKKGNVFVTPVSTAGCIEDIAAEVGFQIRWTAVGAAEVARTCLNQRLPLGGEQNGGVIFAYDNPSRDAGRTSIEILKLIKQRPLSELIDEVPKYYIKKTKLKHDNNMLSKRPEIMKMVMDEFSRYEINQIDGVKIKMDKPSNTSCLMRFSQTETFFKVFTNGKNNKIVNKVHSQCIEKVRNVLNRFETGRENVED